MPTPRRQEGEWSSILRPGGSVVNQQSKTTFNRQMISNSSETRLRQFYSVSQPVAQLPQHARLHSHRSTHVCIASAPQPRPVRVDQVGLRRCIGPPAYAR